jgi:hypothetical protein
MSGPLFPSFHAFSACTLEFANTQQSSEAAGETCRTLKIRS